MNEDINSLFSKEGAIGRLLTGYSKIKFSDPALYVISDYLIKSVRKEKPCIRPCDLDLLISQRKKISVFRPGDVIYYAESIDDPRLLSSAADKCVTSVASLFCACDSFCLDIAAAGAESVTEIAEGIFFVIPDKARSRIRSAILSACSGARECGIVTCDGMIAFIKNGENYLSSPRYEIQPPSDDECAVIDSTCDYNAGALFALDHALKLLSPCAFPFKTRPEMRYTDPLAYRLGIAAMSARGFGAAKRRSHFPDGDMTLSFIPLPYINNRADIPAWHEILKDLKSNASGGKTAFALSPDTAYEAAQFTYARVIKPEVPSSGGYIAVLTQE